MRRLILVHRPLAAAMLALALLMKLALPAGFMPATSDGRMIVSICSGTGPMTMAVDVAGLGDRGAGDKHTGKAAQPCAFASLAAPSLAAADPVLLAAAILFVIALGICPLVLPTPAPRRSLRPPPRGPPALI